MSQYVNIREASKLVGLSVISLRRAVKSGRFPHVRVGGTPRGKILLNLQDLAQILADEAYATMHKEDKNDEE